MTRDEIIQRYCLLASEVWNARFEASHPNDCFCGQGGLWDLGDFAASDFQNDGLALEWIEKVVRSALAQTEVAQ